MNVFLTREAQEQYKKLIQSDREKIDKKIILLKKEPFIGKKLTGKYKETRSLKAWPYRIVYFINERKNEIWIVSILHRQGVYKK